MNFFQPAVRSGFLLSLLLLLGFENAFGFSYVMMRDSDLLAQSQVVVVGKVQDIIEIADSSGALVASRYRVEVERNVKGAPSASIDIEIPGVRELGEGRMWFPSAPHFFVDDRVLWFLEQVDGDLYRPMQYALGVFNLRRWQDRDYAVRPLRGTAVVPRGGPNYVEPSNVRHLDGFVDYLQALPSASVAKQRKEARLNIDPVAANYFVTDTLIRSAIAGDLFKPFTFLSSGGRVFRWPDFDSSGTVQWLSNGSGGASYGAETAQATSAWTSASGSNISLIYAGTTTASSGLTASDGANTVLFEDPNNEIGGSYSCVSGGTVAIGGPRAVGTHVFDGTTYWTSNEGDVVVQNGASCLLDEFGGANAAEVISHEIGHALGLGHACGDGDICDGNRDEAIMRADAHADGRGASLGVDDIAAVAFLYSDGEGNQSPTVGLISNQAISEGASTTAVAFTVNDADGDENSLTISGSSSNTSLVPNGNIIFGGSGASRTVTVTTATTGAGVATITVTADDGTGTGTEAFTVTVSASEANLPPTISSISNQSIEKNTNTGPLAFSVSDPDDIAAELLVNGTSSNKALVPNNNIVISGAASDRTVTVTPLTNASGSTTITLTVSDGVNENSQKFNLSVFGSNSVPTISAIANQTIEVNESTGSLSFSVDDDNDVEGLSVTASSSNQALVSDRDIILSGSGFGRTVSVTPNAGVSGTSTITLTVDDGAGSASTSFVMTVNAAVDPLLVRSLSDSGTSSLREVVANANDGDIISFDAVFFQANDDVTNNPRVSLASSIVVDKNLHIDGDVNGDGIGDVGITSESGIFEVLTPVVLQLSGLYLSETEAAQGGAVLIDGGGEVIIANTLMSENVAQFGGAIAVVDGSLTVVDSEFERNSAATGGAIAIADTAGTVDIQRSAFIFNNATAEGGAVYNLGADTTLANVTIYGSSANFGGGLFNGRSGLLTANNMTVFNNSGGGGIGISGGELVLSNSIVAQLQANEISIEVDGGNLVVSHSLVESISGEFQDLGGNLFDISPGLSQPSEPVNYGGFTRTLSPSSRSPVLDAADPNIPGAGGTCEIEDQTGSARPIDADSDGSAICDMGAFEFSLVSGASPSSESIDIVQEQYIAFYGRAGDPVGVQFWGTRLDQLNKVLSGIQNQFGNSQEFIDLIVPVGSSSVDDLSLQQKADLINNLYSNMFGRSVEGQADDPATGLGFWISELDRPEVSLIDISTRVADGAQAQDRVVLDSRVILARRITEEFVAQDKSYTDQHIEPIRNFLFEQIDDENDDANFVNVAAFVAGLED